MHGKETEEWKERYFNLVNKRKRKKTKKDVNKEEEGRGGEEEEEEGDDDGDEEEEEEEIRIHQTQNLVSLFDAVRANDEKKVKTLIGRCPPLHTSLDAHGRTVLHHAVFKVCFLSPPFPPSL